MTTSRARFLVNNAVSPSVARSLAARGLDAIHVRDLGIQHADDEVIFEAAAGDRRVIVSADTDFGAILARRRTASPSLILFRHGAERLPERQVDLIMANLTQIEQALIDGCVVTIEPSRLRIRSLPIA